MFELTETQRQIQDAAAKLAKTVIQPRAADIDKSEQYPWENVKALTDAGFMGMTIPEAYGGQGASYLDAVLVVEEMGKVCGVTSRIVVEGNMGAIGAIMAYGTEDQKKLAAGLVLAGDKPAICITEPGAGSAASEMTTRADKTKGGYVLNGAKHWITGGGVSKLHLIFARVFEDGEPQGIAGFICARDVDLETPEGLVIGTREPTMGLRGIPETEIIFKDLHIPDDMVLVPPSGLRRGFAGLMTAYNAQRVGAATVALGIAQGAFEQAMDYAQSREQFGRPIAEFQGLQWMLVDMSIAIEAARLMIYKAASGTGGDTGFPDITAAAQAKIMAADMAIKVTTDALQVFGAAGYSRNLPMERMARDARMFTIG
ncbi:MAG: acyl-CoA dehydrogenase, partial [Alphaproteobacteria bacterium]|nr:acyl-CoA dehydrogenase [Alphaproteobacteria bacterium]